MTQQNSRNLSYALMLSEDDAGALRHMLRAVKADAIKKFGEVGDWPDDMLKRIEAALAQQAVCNTGFCGNGFHIHDCALAQQAQPVMNEPWPVIWSDAGYGFEKARLANGFIKMSVGWDSTVPKGTPTGWKATVNGMRLRAIFESAAEAKSHAEGFARRRMRVALDELREWVIHGDSTAKPGEGE